MTTANTSEENELWSDGFENINLNVTGATTVNYFGDDNQQAAAVTANINAAANFTVAKGALGTAETYLGNSDTTNLTLTVAGAGNVTLADTYLENDQAAGHSIVVNASALTGDFSAKFKDVDSYKIASIKGGSGNDTIIIDGLLTSVGTVDGGAGTNTIGFGNDSTLSGADLRNLNGDIVTNFQKVEFLNALTLDASKLASTYTAVKFDADSTVTKVSTQALTAKGALTATAADYDSTTTPVTYGSTTLNVTETGASKSVTLNASAASLNVTSSTTTAAGATVHGDLKTLTVNLTNAANADVNPTGDNDASVSLTTVKGTTNDLAALTKVTLTGNGYATIDNSNSNGSTANAATKLATIDASGLGGTVGFGTDKGNVTGGLDFTANNNVAESITLGSGTDTIRDAGSTYDLMDTITGFDAVKETANGKSTTDILVFDGITIDGTATNVITKVAGTFLNITSALDAAAAASTSTGLIAQVVYNNNTYLVKDDGGTANAIDLTDHVIKLVGTVDLSSNFAVHA